MAKYPDLKSYLQVNYNELLTDEVQKFVDAYFDGSDFHSINVLSLLRHKIENLEVKALTCHDDSGPIIKMDVGVSADIVEKGLGTSSYEADRKHKWFMVYLQGILRDGLTDIKVLNIEEYHNRKFEKENVLDQFLVPYIYTASLEEIADDFLLFYCGDTIYDGYRFPLENILAELEIKYYLADLPDNCFGRMYFRKAVVTVYSQDPYIGDVKQVDKEIEPGTMLINRQKYYLGIDGTQRLTIAHELIHWHFHQKYISLLALLDDHTDMMSCEIEPGRFEEGMTMAQKAHWFVEWQANALAMRIVMPRELMKKAIKEARDTAPPYNFTGDLVENLLRRVAALFDVPIFAAKQRARQLGFDNVDGAFVYVDGKRHEPFAFKKGSLEAGQTYIIDKDSYEKLYQSNWEFSKEIDSGNFIYLGYVVCINDPQYIKADLSGNHAILKLSDYAREHADECCLKFSLCSTSCMPCMQDKFEFYGESYLSKEVKKENYVEHYYNGKINQVPKQSATEIKEGVAAYLAFIEEERKVQMELLLNNCNTFAATLIYHMKRKQITVEQLAERSNLSDTTIKKYRSGKSTPPIENVMAICIGLNLPKNYSMYLLEICSYTLGSSPRDRAYKFCLDFDDKTIDDWNIILEAFGQPRIPYIRNQKIA